jgi:2-octaprenyl-6-methoxyphenol hydroxylase
MEIVILGAGYTGLITALALAHYGIRTKVIERSLCDENFFNDPRTTSINLHSCAFLTRLNLWEELRHLVSEIRRIYVVNNKGSDMIDFSHQACSDHTLALGYMICNSDLKKHLYHQAAQNSLIEIIDGAVYQSVAFDQQSSGGPCLISLSNLQKISASLLVACDGRNSELRRQHFPYLINKSYRQVAFVFNIVHEKEHENCAVEHFLDKGVFAVLPLRDQKQSAIVWCVEDFMAQVYIGLDPQGFTDVLLKTMGDFLGSVQIISKVDYFNLSAQMVEKYFFANSVLVGDAAHSIHPLAGQGLNQGIKDVEALSSIIAKYSKLGLDINQVALREYSKARRFDNFKMFFATDFLDKIFANQSCIANFVKKASFGFFNKFPKSKSLILRYGIGT